ncbi:MAG: DUF4382 domain-containing protein, partial [candidate division WOR-3 bacterium]|nr:DUF4382 domain-containing protein [candidate division WOR-3 bacterium]
IMRFFTGGTGLLCVKTLEAGHYTDIWLEFADTNGIVIDGVPYPLIIQNEEETGVKLAQEFDVTKDETVEIVVDFEASKSIEWTGEQYLLHPEFRVFEKAFSGAVLGSVEDTLGAGIPNALCEGVTSTFDTLSTLTDSTGGYVLILLRDTYKIIASAEGYTTSDTVYSDVVVVADSILEGYDFILQ